MDKRMRVKGEEMKNLQFFGFRLTHDIRAQIATLSQKLEVSQADIARQALKLGLQRFEQEAFRIMK